MNQRPTGLKVSKAIEGFLQYTLAVRGQPSHHCSFDCINDHRLSAITLTRVNNGRWPNIVRIEGLVTTPGVHACSGDQSE